MIMKILYFKILILKLINQIRLLLVDLLGQAKVLLVELLTGLNLPSFGQILIDDVDLKKCNKK